MSHESNQFIHILYKESSQCKNNINSSIHPTNNIITREASIVISYHHHRSRERVTAEIES